MISNSGYLNNIRVLDLSNTDLTDKDLKSLFVNEVEGVER